MSFNKDTKFEEWWMSVEPRVRRLGRSFLSSGDAAVDLSQEVALAALMHFPNFQNQEHFSGWVMTRARWLALDRLRSLRRLSFIETTDDRANSLEPAIAASSVEDDMILRDTMRAIAKLPERQRVVTLRTIEGYSANEIGKELGVTEATVRSLLRHARAKLVLEDIG